MIALVNLVIRLWCWIEFILFTVIMYLLSYLPSGTGAGTRSGTIGRIYEHLFHVWTHVFVRAMGVSVKVHQHYASTLPDHYIVIANHPSAFEDIGMPSLFKAYSVAKIGVADWFIVGRISTAAGTIYLNRDDKSSRAAAGDSITQALEQGKNIAIYPEGGCYGRRISQFLYGIFGISLDTQVPIVPVFIHYEAQEDFEWQGQTLPKKMWQIMTASNRTANFHVYEPFLPQNYTDRESFCDDVHSHYLRWQDKHLL